MRVPARLALGSMLVAVAAVAATVSASQAAAASDVIGHVYVNDNTAAANTVAGFDRHADGTLTPDRPARPFAVGGAGTGHGIGSQGALQLSLRRSLPARGRRRQQSDLGARIKPDGSRLTVGGGKSYRLRGQRAREHRRPRQPRLRRQRRRRRQQLHRASSLHRGGHLRPLADSTYALPDGSLCRATCSSTAPAHASSARASARH